MTETYDIDPEINALVGEWFDLKEAATALGLNQNRVKQLVNDGQLLGLPFRGGLLIPVAFFDDKEIVKKLSGTLVQLKDAGFTDLESLRWLFADDGLPGSPIQALRENRGTEVRRRAQALGL
ncbi:MAG: Rv2175c family DNA-binding protein [Streptosporangiaceae bacterium]